MVQGEISIDQAVDGLLGGQEPDSGAPAPQEHEAASETSDDAVELQKGPPGGHEDADSTESGEGEEADQEVSQAEDDDPEVSLMNGQGTAKLSELIKSYQLQATWDKKLSEVKREREVIQQAKEDRRQAAEARQQYIDQVTQLAQRLGTLDEVQDPPEELRNTDPLRYQEQKIAAIEQRERIRQVNEARNSVMQEQYQEQMRLRQEHLASEKDKLLESIPEWQDEQVQTREGQEIANYAVSHGYSPQEAATVADHRAVVLLRKAMMYDKLMESGKPTIAQKVAKAAPTISQARTLKSKPTTAAQKAEKAFAKVAGQGGMDAIDAAADWLIAKRGSSQ